MPVYRLTGFDIPDPQGRVLADFPEVLNAFNRRASLIVQREARENAWEFRDTSALARSIQAEVRDMTAIVQVPANQPTAAYADVMERGRRPYPLNNGANSHMPPPQALHGWMRRHGIPIAYAYVVARAINRRGIEGRFYMRRAYESLQQQIPEIMAWAFRTTLP